MVRFQPDVEQKLGPEASFAISDEKGQYSLARDSGLSGALVAKHHVLVFRGRPADRGIGEEQDPDSPEVIAGLKDRRRIPAAYKNPANTPLVVDVRPEQHVYNLELSSERKQ
jgi:hypothetical protein